MKKIYLVLGLTLCSSLIAGNLVGKYAQRATSVPISVVDITANSGFYLGLGLGKFKLKNRDFNEKLKSDILAIIAGYNINDYIAIEARYYKGLTNINYHSNNISKKIESKYSNISIFAKFKYPIENFTPYLLLGYGANKISNLEGANRKAKSISYGIGTSYKVTEDVSVFADYIRVYNKKGFDGRAKQDRLRANLITVGATYNF